MYNDKKFWTLHGESLKRDKGPRYTSTNGFSLETDNSRQCYPVKVAVVRSIRQKVACSVIVTTRSYNNKFPDDVIYVSNVHHIQNADRRWFVVLSHCSTRAIVELIFILNLAIARIFGEIRINVYDLIIWH